MGKKRLDKFCGTAAEVFPETLDVAERTKRTKKEIEEGLVRDAPRTWKGCKNWGDAWLYLFQTVALGKSHFLHWKEDKVITVVFQGHEFCDLLIEYFGKFEERLGPNIELLELRLIYTGFSPHGVKWL